jgi:hypothetical protein
VWNRIPVGRWPREGVLVDVEMIRRFLLWCAVLNYGLLVLWTVIYMLPHEWVYRLTSRLFRVSAEQFDLINIAAMTLFKMGIILFNLVPYVALLLAG